ncbi:PspC domain-containing protein [Bacillus horti]|uniref:Phage shock protein C n=1 Tax=Caldalkalibacillus horti TaxID=77523 RepID=A0ABT9VUM2_9BACI|nr:PspC domain-containing protein [Bacillus horti]MDQ0164325.1 phage shock protein C [Bacillus horti]
MQNRLYKSRNDKILDGVCGGIARYFNVDAVLIRLIWVIASIFLGQIFFGVIAYLIAMIIIPTEPGNHRTQKINKETDEQQEYTQNESAMQNSSNSSMDDYNDEKSYSQRSGSSTSFLLGLICIVIGALVILGNVFDFNLRTWFRMSSDIIWPSLLIGLGLLLLIRRPRH